eukprot:TRINITY_DN7356_c0_g4_i1.p1 TRINITY_DN7356_c0_g4~~TRINITY_DN7356_c0_g4_i1.p1  ORF type:complete len:444 (-),score=134.80 TRINITY_DN7356_c0_g4_i1:3-1334(-)
MTQMHDDLLQNYDKIKADLVEAQKLHLETSKKILQVTLEMENQKAKKSDAADAPQGIVTLAFTDVQGSTTQWEMHPDVMAHSLSLHNDLMRSKIKEFEGYEVKVEGDAFMVAFSSTLNAVKWAIDVQEKLLEVNWPEECLKHPDASVENVDGKNIYIGLRVRIGLHVGEPRCEIDPVTQRMDYFGPMVNRSARVEQCTHGGQIVISENVKSKIKDDLEKMTDIAKTKYLGEFKLKGIDEALPLYQVAPVSLKSRKFPIPAGSTNEKQTQTQDLEKQLSELNKLNSDLHSKLTKIEQKANDAIKQALTVAQTLRQFDSKDKKVSTALTAVESLVLEQGVVKEELERTKQENLTLIKKMEEMDNRVEQVGSTLTDEIDKSEELQNALKEIARLQKELDDLKKTPVVAPPKRKEKKKKRRNRSKNFKQMETSSSKRKINPTTRIQT